MSNSINTLKSYTGLSETELSRRAQDLVATGKVQNLKALDAALVSTSAGQVGGADPFSASAAQSAQPHVTEEPAAAMARTSDVGFASGMAVGAPTIASAHSPAVLDRAAASGQKKIENSGIASSLMAAEADIMKLAEDAKNGVGGSRDVLFEQLKMQTQRISEIFQTLTNVMSSANDAAKTAINNVKA